MSKNKKKKEESDGVFIIETMYLCGARIGFATRNVDLAASKAAQIMTDICPECKQALGEELTQDDKDVLSVGPEAHAKAREN
jgi:hypothetical protein